MRVKKILVLIFPVVFIFGCVSADKNEIFTNHPLSIVQGVTNETETVVSVLSSSAEEPLIFYYGDLEDEKKEEKKLITPYFEELSPDGSRKIYKLHIKNLSLEKDYYLLILNKENLSVVDERGFKALNLKMEKPKIGLASCFDDREEKITSIWKEYLNQNTDINFFIGDNVYADKLGGKWGIEANQEQLWRRYAETFERLYFYHSSFLTPTLYLWDDHDFGLNDGGREFKYKEDALNVFKAFYPLKEIKGVYEFTKGAGSIFKAFNQNFVFIDARFFRSEKTAKEQTQWGSEQEGEVFSQLNSRKSLTWLIQGDQFFGAYHPFESYQKDRPASFLKMLAKLKKAKSRVLFVSGDRHLTEVMKIKKEVLGYQTYEITSSAMHAKVFPGSYERNPNPNLLVGKSGVFNYSIIEPVVTKKKAVINIESKGLKGITHYEKEVQVSL